MRTDPKPRMDLGTARTIVRDTNPARVNKYHGRASFESLPGDRTKEKILAACELVKKSFRAQGEEKHRARALGSGYKAAFAERDRHRRALGISDEDGTSKEFRDYWAQKKNEPVAEERSISDNHIPSALDW